LLNNAPPNVEYAQAYGSGITIKEFVERQRDIWNVEYEPPIEEPIKEKIQNIDQYVLFRVQLFGGILAVVAKNFAVKGATKRDAQTARDLDHDQDGSLSGDNRQRSAAERAVMFGSGTDVDGGIADDAG
jgi:hypothetical protein